MITCMQVHTQNSICQFQNAVKGAEFHSFKGTENIYNAMPPRQPHLVTGSKNEKNLYDNNKKMNFHFNRQSLGQHWLSCHPALLKAFRPFTGMSQKSIAIYSLFGPRATKVNNTVTSSLPAEHGHKTALPLKYNLTQLFIYASAADCIGFHRGQILQQSHTERSSSCT